MMKTSREVGMMISSTLGICVSLMFCAMVLCAISRCSTFGFMLSIVACLFSVIKFVKTYIRIKEIFMLEDEETKAELCRVWNEVRTKLNEQKY